VLDALNPQQREAVELVDGPLLLVAGAGSGKTRVLTTRIAHLLHDHSTAPESILAFTFTNKAAREMRERVDAVASGDASNCWIGTFHATGARILRRQAHRLGYPNQFTIFDADDSRTLYTNILKSLRADSKQFSPRGVASEISNFKNRSMSPEDVRSQALTAREETLAKIYEQYSANLRQNGAMDFDDLIARTVELLEHDEAVLARYARQFEYVLVDEFQDTNPLQLILIKALCSRSGNLFAVGDDDQSIYSWRGATVENMLHFEDYFPGARVLRLEQNYRSTSTILRASNAVIAHNKHRKGKSLWSDKGEGEHIELWWADDGDDEGSIIRDRILALLAEEGCRRQDIAILYRTNAQSRALEDALRREGIPYQIAGGTRFFERREVRDVMAYCKAIVNPKDGVSVQRILNVPRRGLGKTTAERLFVAAAAKGMGPSELCAQPAQLGDMFAKGARTKLAAFGKLMGDLRRLAESTDAGAVVRQILAATGYESWLDSDDPGTAEERRENVSELVHAAQLFAEESEGASLADFVESVALLSEVDRLQDSDDLVTLMTMHNAKGLEFPTIFVAGCEEGLLPHASSMEDDAGVEEERRLFYVALTRAEERLFLSSASSRQRFGRFEPMLPSRFLEELPEDCVQEQGLARRSYAPPPRRASRTRTSSRSNSTIDLDLPAFGVETFRKSGVQRRSAGHGFRDDEINQEEIHYAAGQRVRHELLGDGVIEKIEGMGDLMRLTIDFEGAGKKRVLARFARLTLLDEMS